MRLMTPARAAFLSLAALALTGLPFGSPAVAGPASPCPMFLIRRTLVAPAPGAAGVSRTLGTIVVSGPAQVAFLKSADGATLRLRRAARPQTFVVPPLAANTTYAVWVQDTEAPADCPAGAPLKIGSFTTR